MNYKEEYKKLKKEMFLIRFNADMEKFKNEHNYEYGVILAEIKDSLFDVYLSDKECLKDLVKKYSYETVEKYFLDLKNEGDE